MAMQSLCTLGVDAWLESVIEQVQLCLTNPPSVRKVPHPGPLPICEVCLCGHFSKLFSGLNMCTFSVERKDCLPLPSAFH